MFSKNHRMILVTAILILALGSGCSRSLSTPPAVTPTLITFNATPLVTINPIDALSTQAAARTLTPGTPGTPTATRTPGTPAIGGGTEITPGPTNTPTATMPVLNQPTATSTLPSIVVPTSTPGRPATYALQSGEWPYCIARRFNVNQADLMALNNLSEAQALSLPVGTVLKIPQTGSFVGDRSYPNNHPATYTVISADETFNSIACKYGDVEPSSIAIANNLSLGSVLRAGQSLRIP